MKWSVKATANMGSASLVRASEAKTVGEKNTLKVPYSHPKSNHSLSDSSSNLLLCQ